METKFKIGERVIVQFDGYTNLGTVIDTRSTETFVRTVVGTTWYNNVRVSSMEKATASRTINKIDIHNLIGIIRQEICDTNMISLKNELDVTKVYNEWKETLK